MLPIDPNFQANWVAMAFQNHNVRKDHSCNLAIYGTNVGVDFDLCIGDRARFEVCSVDVFDWQGETHQRKALPLCGYDCTYCLGCEVVYPKFVTRVTKP